MKSFRINAILLCAITFFAFNSQSQSIQNKISSYLSEEMDNMGLSKTDIKDWVITTQHDSKEFAITYVYTNQRYQGVEIHNAVANFAVKDGEVFLAGNRFEKNIENRINTTTPVLTEVQAIEMAAKHLALDPNSLSIELMANESSKYIESNLSLSPIPVKAVYAKNENGKLRLAWDLSLELTNRQHYWSIRIDAVTGELIDKIDWTVNCKFDSEEKCTHTHINKVEHFAAAPPPPPGTDQYNVFAIPIESPNHGSRSLLVGPSSPIASPYGWHDDDGVIGEEYTITRGNNVNAYEDTSDVNSPGYSPDGGPSLNFDFPFDPNQPEYGFWDPAITNLFYMNNVIHDVLYRYGFDEPSGNFQQNNYGNGGSSSDYVRAEAQDGSGTNNANFSTPPDGNNPRMQMYLWTGQGTPQYLQINSPGAFVGIYDSKPAGIGTTIPLAGITGDMVIFDDGVPDNYDACEPAINAAALNGNIAVIRKGGSCDYVDKLVAAEAAGAIAVIVVNTNASVLTMNGTDPGIGIPGIMVSSTDGDAFITEIETNGSMNCTIANYGPFDYDSDLDNGIIAHEYGHGVSNRLTGGGTNTSCLYNEEQMGEGWSDFFALMFTMEPGDLGTDVRGIGTYAIGEPVNGPGIRPAPYSTDPSVNNSNYGWVSNQATISQPHGIGFVWCTMLWDLTWKLIDAYGYDPDLYNGNGGNNIALQLVMNGMKLQPCGPGFVDGRDAILAADEMLYGGANKCFIWEAFANRGCGYSADQGDPDNRSDQIAAFDLPSGIDHTTTATRCQEYVWAENGVTYTQSGTYTTPVTPSFGCDSVATLYLTITPTISTSVSYINPVTLQVNVQPATYQWLNCSDGMSPLVGETNSLFNAPSNGIYAVALAQGNCLDTSVCFLINQVGIDEQTLDEIVSVYPNPTSGSISIDFNNHQYSEVDIKVLNSLGQIIHNSMHHNTVKCEIEIADEAGIYFVEITAEDSITVVKVVKQE